MGGDSEWGKIRLQFREMPTVFASVSDRSAQLVCCSASLFLSLMLLKGQFPQEKEKNLFYLIMFGALRRMVKAPRRDSDDVLVVEELAVTSHATLHLFYH